MKVFHAELTANPSYYSYGYAVYGLIEDGDDLDDIYACGFLPFIGARDQEEGMVYMARGTRIRLSGYAETNDQTNVLRRLQKDGLAPIERVVHERSSFPVTGAFIAFLQAYFDFRFGKGAMPAERLTALISSPLLTHIIEYRFNGKPVGYLLETQTGGLSHVWYEAYAKEYAGRHLGMYLFIDFIRRAKDAGKDYAYFGATYGNWMRYKTNFRALEFWDGARWITDATNKQLKKLLVDDPTRLAGFVDEWRKGKRPYHPSPYPFRSPLASLRYVYTLAVLYPKFVGAMLLLLAAFAAFIQFQLILF